MNADYTPPAPSNDRTMAMLAHVLGIFTSFIGPLVIWLISKDKPQDAYAADQAREALNFQLTMLIIYIIGGILSLVLIGFLINAVAGVAALIFSILAAVKANDGVNYRYPFALRMIK